MNNSMDMWGFEGGLGDHQDRFGLLGIQVTKGGKGGGVKLPTAERPDVDLETYKPPQEKPDLHAAHIVFRMRVKPETGKPISKLWGKDAVSVYDLTYEGKDDGRLSSEEASQLVEGAEGLKDWSDLTENPTDKKGNEIINPVDRDKVRINIREGGETRSYLWSEVVAIANSPEVSGADDPTGTTSELKKDAAKNDEMRRKLKRMLADLKAKLEAGTATLEDVVQIIGLMTNEMKMGLLDAAKVVVAWMGKIDATTSKARENIAKLTKQINPKSRDTASFYKLNAKIKEEENKVAAGNTLRETAGQYLQTGLSNLREMTDYNNSILAGFLEYTRSASRVG